MTIVMIIIVLQEEMMNNLNYCVSSIIIVDTDL